MNTKEKLARSFKELATQKDVDKVTIGEIADHAGVMRATFYNHFKDKSDLIKWGMREVILIPVRDQLRKGDYRCAAETLFSLILERKEFFIALSGMTKPATLERVLDSGIRGILYENAADRGIAFPEDVWVTPQMICDLYAKIVASIVVSWIGRGMDISVDKISDFSEYMCANSLRKVVHDIRDGSISGLF